MGQSMEETELETVEVPKAPEPKEEPKEKADEDPGPAA